MNIFLLTIFHHIFICENFQDFFYKKIEGRFEKKKVEFKSISKVL